MAMVQPADTAVKTNQILARFRPIAPKPATPTSPPAQPADGSRVLCQLQSRPCRARKRGRPAVVPVSPPAAAAKRERAAAYPAPLRCAAPTDAVVATATRAHVSVAIPAATACLSFATLSPESAGSGDPPKAAAADEAARDVPVERDLLQKLLEPKVISPRALRPVSSTIRIESVAVRGDDDGADERAAAGPKTAREVEAELETDALPAVVTDSANRIRLVNDAYKKMVGEPECAWLDAVAAPASRRISGEVALVVAGEQAALPESGRGFSCMAKIEWERDGNRSSIVAPCDVSRLQCESRDYLFAWKFSTADAYDVSHRTGDAA